MTLLAAFFDDEPGACTIFHACMHKPQQHQHACSPCSAFCTEATRHACGAALVPAQVSPTAWLSCWFSSRGVPVDGRAWRGHEVAEVTAGQPARRSQSRCGQGPAASRACSQGLRAARAHAGLLADPPSAQRAGWCTANPSLTPMLLSILSSQVSVRHCCGGCYKAGISERNDVVVPLHVYLQIEAARAVAAAVRAVPLLGVTFLPLIMHLLQAASSADTSDSSPEGAHAPALSNVVPTAEHTNSKLMVHIHLHRAHGHEQELARAKGGALACVCVQRGRLLPG
jgi:hypothetical protein